LTAVREHRWLSFTYARTAGSVRDDRAMQPYAVHAHEGQYYVWGVLEGEHLPKLFALDRMEDVVIETDTFAPDPGLDLNDALRYSFSMMIDDGPVQHVIVRIAAEAAAFVRCRRWPSEVRIDERDDASVALTFGVSRFEEVVAWVLSFGGAATIESPEVAEKRCGLRAQRVMQDFE
jgi:predicted DNA-binding transcriptional regulator YafY